MEGIGTVALRRNILLLVQITSIRDFRIEIQKAEFDEILKWKF